MVLESCMNNNNLGTILFLSYHILYALQNWKLAGIEHSWLISKSSFFRIPIALKMQRIQIILKPYCYTTIEKKSLAYTIQSAKTPTVTSLSIILSLMCGDDAVMKTLPIFFVGAWKR